MSKHTPGPWAVDPTVSSGEVMTAHGYAIHEHPIYSSITDAKEIQANARLIAAAPDLLKALNSLRSAAYWIVEGGEFAHWVNDKTMPLAAAKELAELAEMVQAAQTIIDKATGETK